MKGMCTVRMAGNAYFYGNQGTDCFYREDVFLMGDMYGAQKTALEIFTEFVRELGKAIINFGMKVIGAFDTALNEVKAAVEKVVDVIGALVDWIKEAIISLVKQAIDSIFDGIKDQIESIGKQFFYIALNETGSSSAQITTRGLAENIHISQNDWKKIVDKQTYYACVILPLIFIIGTAVFALTTAMGYLIMSVPIIGAAITGLITGALTAVILGTIMTSEYYDIGKDMDTSSNGIKRWLEDEVNPAVSMSYSSIVDFWMPIFAALVLGQTTGTVIKSMGLYFLSIFASMVFLAIPPTPESGFAMIPFLALAYAGMGSVVLEALTGMLKSWKDAMWGKIVAIGLIYLLIGVSLYLTIKADLGYVAEAFV